MELPLHAFEERGAVGGIGGVDHLEASGGVVVAVGGAQQLDLARAGLA
ncbi:hypothetical protein [Streptomyces silvisoli]|uniref:Uncharacterized protein n=1 Tax=Streptomyces silvisoli TaxID=3034235 RepID=A0ABT5ZP71_9ACTN|nr:hypothetical protein [Streptomyces silvisoli]MDF3291634.1 hypothetical protein [Streptomyces silvisoli]